MKVICTIIWCCKNKEIINKDLSLFKNQHVLLIYYIIYIMYNYWSTYVKLYFRMFSFRKPLPIFTLQLTIKLFVLYKYSM